MGPRMFEIRVIPKNTGGRLPLLFYSNPYSPVRLPFHYLVLTAQRQYADSTCGLIVRVLKDLYTYCYVIAAIDLETQLLHGKMLSVDQLTGYARWLRLGRNFPSNIVAHIGIPEAQTGILSANTFNDYLYWTKTYLLWTVQTFTPENTTFRDIEKTFDDVKTRLESLFKSLHIKSRPQKHTKGLSKSQVKQLLKVVDPNSPKNPFKDEAVRYRNWCIIKILLATGMRRAEILCAHTADAPDIRFENIWHIRKRNPEPEDPRNPQPSVKTLERDIKLTETESTLVKKYIDKYRWTFTRLQSGEIKKGKPHHPFLIINTQSGAPLSLDSINKMLKKYKDVAFPDEPIELHPHTLRNTFCNDFLEHSVDVKGDSVELAIDNLKRICGWTDKSEMPTLYAAKWKERKADEATVSLLKQKTSEQV
jgi:integrase